MPSIVLEERNIPKTDIDEYTPPVYLDCICISFGPQVIFLTYKFYLRFLQNNKNVYGTNKIKKDTDNILPNIDAGDVLKTSMTAMLASMSLHL